MRRLACFVMLLIFGGLGCGDRARPMPMAGSDASVGPGGCTPGGPSFVCSGSTEFRCNTDGTVASRRDCRDEALVCAAGIGCAVCLPGSGIVLRQFRDSMPPRRKRL